MDKKTQGILLNWGALFVWMVVVFNLSALPVKDIPKCAIPNIDKVVHFLEFIVLGLLVIRAFLGSGLKISVRQITILAILTASLYAAADEWHQHYVPGRTPDIFDFFTDFLGLNVGILLYKRRM